MAIKAVVFDIGGVLEITPMTGWEGKWAERLGMSTGDMLSKLRDVWRAGDVGQLSEEEIRSKTAEILGLDQDQLNEFYNDLWDEYLGTLNTELAQYFAGLRPRVRTAILSNSFVGAREREQERYGFGDMCELIVYSHEVGVKKPDPRIYEMVWQRLGIEPSEMIFVDNYKEAVDPAVALGIHGIVFKDNEQTISDIEECIARESENSTRPQASK